MFFYHFGLEGFLGLALYCAGLLCALLSLWRPKIGLFYIVPLLPLQTTRYRMNQYPDGSGLITLILIGVSVGLLLRREGLFSRTPWSILLAIYAGYQFLTFLLGIAYLPSLTAEDTLWRFREWIDYMMMPLLLILVAGAITSKRDMAILSLLMCLSILVVDRSFWSAVKDRDFSNYTDDLREAGPLGQAGANGLGAFEAQSAALLIVLAGFQEKRLRRYACYALAGFSVVCLMYSFSRGAYIAFAVGCVFIGIVRQRKLLVLMLLVGLCWATVLPSVVEERISGTAAEGELDHSSETRLVLWQDALELASENPVFGTGYNTYLFLQRVNGSFGSYWDTHNIYLKVLVETGLIGLLLFLSVMGKMFLTGYRLFRAAEDPFFASLGLGLAAWVVCSAVANLFGDRWTYLQVNSFMWVLGGMVTRAFLLEEAADSAATDDASSDASDVAFDEFPSPRGLLEPVAN